MELRVLRYFWTIAEEENISRAAAILHVTQPTLSRQLRALETELGTPLFDRQSKGLVLTSAGLFLKSRAAEILQLTQQTTQEFVNRRQQLFSGHITVGCVEADNSDTLAMLLEDFVSDYPQVTFDIFSGASDIITDRLDKGLLDMAILLEPVNTDKYHTLTLPRTETWGLLMAADAFLARQDHVTPADLAGMPLMISNRPEVQRLLTNWSGLTRQQLNIIGTFNLSFNALPLVAHQVAAALMIAGAITNRQPAETKFLPLKPAIQTNCVLVWRRDRVLTPVVTEFIRYFKDAFAH
ncbi:LysR family transcriptional regulator [Levilactobacillus suantsaii]|uniref:LysR family transcriptional regulator n=1 Tax=Levilactobacillus suantsaii TaxID=2292255 RepID=UPI0015F37971|nr:LysR family transcriptional regulator [Levilactobacillus suantsaii]QMU07278.1 LysR family transcriptional regulator [Levilactobacillus suantsaii]